MGSEHRSGAAGGDEGDADPAPVNDAAMSDAQRAMFRARMRIALRYAIGALFFAAAAFFTGWWGVLLGWIAMTLALMAAAYAWIGPLIFGKKNGRIPAWTRVILWPHVLGLWIVRQWQICRMNQPWNVVAPGVVLGRILHSHEAKLVMNKNGIGAVLDLSAEHAETSAFLQRDYRNVPVLDLLPPTPDQLRTAAEFIARLAPNQCVYVHCGIGKSRSAAAVAAYLLSGDTAATVEQACEMVRIARPSARFSDEAIAQLRAFASQRSMNASHG